MNFPILRRLRRSFRQFRAKLNSGTDIEKIIVRSIRIRPEDEKTIRDHTTYLIRGSEGIHVLIAYMQTLHREIEFKKDFDPGDISRAREVAFLESQKRRLNHRIEQMQKYT